MSADRKPSGELVRPPPSEEVFAEFVNLAKDRNVLEDRRLSLQEKALELADSQDKRQFEFHSKSRDQHHERSTRRSSFGRQFMWVVLGISILVLGLLLWFAFVGDERQSGIALDVLTTLLTGIGGYGVIHTFTLASRRLMSPPE